MIKKTVSGCFFAFLAAISFLPSCGASGTASEDEEGGTSTSIKAEITYYQNGKLEEKCVYDSNGNLTSCIICYEDDGDVDEIETYTYNSDGKISKAIYSDGDNNLESYITSTYLSGVRVKETVYDAQGVVQGYNTFTYDASGNVTKKEFWDNSDALTGYETYTYDSDGNQTLYEAYFGSSADSPESKTVTEYSASLKVKETYYSIILGTLTVSGSETYEYDGNLLSKRNMYDESGNVSSQTIYLYDENGRRSVANHYTATGAANGYTAYVYY